MSGLSKPGVIGLTLGFLFLNSRKFGKPPRKRLPDGVLRFACRSKTSQFSKVQTPSGANSDLTSHDAMTQNLSSTVPAVRCDRALSIALPGIPGFPKRGRCWHNERSREGFLRSGSSGRVSNGPEWAAPRKHNRRRTPRTTGTACHRGTVTSWGRVVSNAQPNESMPLRCAGAGVLWCCFEWGDSQLFAGLIYLPLVQDSTTKHQPGRGKILRDHPCSLFA